MINGAVLVRIFLFAGGTALLAAPQAAAPTPVNNHYVGSNSCKKCHPDIWSTFYKNPHYKSLVHANDAQAGDNIEPAGCETCHGPGGNHVAAGGGKATIVAFSALSPQKTLDNCLQCHAETLSRANIRRSSHTLSDVVCTTCHSVHN